MNYSSIYFATYHVRVSNRTKDDQILNHFNGSTDLFDVLAGFFDDLFVNQRKEKNDEEQSTSIHFTLKEKPVIDKTNRVIYGFIDSGLSGDNSTIKTLANNEKVMDLDPDVHGAFKELFFYCKLPVETKRGFLILQKKASHGVKGATERMWKRWLKDQGFMDHFIWLNNVINAQLFNMMLEAGNLKKVELIYNYCPETVDDLFGDPSEGIKQGRGKTKTVVTSNTSLSQSWKDIARTALTSRGKNTIIETAKGSTEFDEMEFKLELNGQEKTFYAKNKSRTLPDLDVTDGIIFHNKKPTLDSLVSKSEEVIRDVFKYRGDV